MIDLLKMPLLICQSGWKEIWNALLVIFWVPWGPEQGYQGCFVVVTNRGTLRYICDNGYSELVHKIDQTETIFVCRTQTNQANLTDWKELCPREKKRLSQNTLPLVLPNITAQGNGTTVSWVVSKLLQYYYLNVTGRYRITLIIPQYSVGSSALKKTKRDGS